MKRTMKRTFALILSLLLCVSIFLPTAAFADSSPDDFTYDGNTITKYIGTDPIVVIPEEHDGTTITGIGHSAFQYMDITSVSMPDSITDIDYDVFRGCSALENITLSNNLTSIRSHTFNGCTSLKKIVIPDSVTNIGNYAFANCTSLSEIVLSNSLTSLGLAAFSTCTSLNEIVFPNSLSSLDSFAFANCTSLREIIIPTNVTSIGDSAFAGCTNLEAVTFETGLTAIGVDAFRGCTSLQSIDIPATVTAVYAGAFNNSTGLSNVTVHWTENPPSATIAFINIDPDAVLYVPEGTRDIYAATSGWSDFLNLGGIVEGTAPTSPEFVSSVSFSKDYNDKYTTGSKTTAVNETVTYTIAPVTENAPAFANNTVTVSVEDGIGSGEIVMPEDITAPGSYWYTLTENVGSTAGVDYDGATYYLHLLTAYIDGAYGVTSAQIHTTAPAANGTWRDDDKVSTLSNTYGEGNLTVKQTVSGNGANNEDEFTVTVTFNAGDKTVVGNITYGEDGVISPEDWENGSTSVEITLHGDESITFSNIPDGVTYTVTQNEGYADLSYSAPTYALADNEDPDTAGTENATGQITNLIDQVIINNEKSIPIDVGVILENGAFILLILGALAVGGYLVIARKKRDYETV